MGNDKKTTGLAAFTKKQAAPQPDAAEPTEKPRTRGKGDIVAMTIRLNRADWQRVHGLALSDGVSIQSLVVDGLSKLLKEKGLPPLG